MHLWNWCMWPWRLTSPKTWRMSGPSGDTGELIVYSSLRPAALKFRKNPCFSLSPKAEKKLVSKFKGCQVERILCSSGRWVKKAFNLQDKAHSYYGRQSAWSTDLNVNPIQKHPYRNTHPSWHIKLTITTLTN